MDIKEIIRKKEYDFLRSEECLKGRLVFLTFGGSHAYGTAAPGSDVDVRGCALNGRSDLLGMGSFEQFIDEGTDTTIYSFNKLVRLFLGANPNTIEMLGCKPEHYVFFSPVAQELLDNRKMFLSRRAAGSFSGYAEQQLRRLQNAVARDRLTQTEKEKFILGSIKQQMQTFNDRYAAFENGALRLYIDESDKAGFDSEIFMDANLKHYPLRDYASMWAEMKTVVSDYDSLNHRNNKKSEGKLAKHAMHLVRLYLMAIDIFEKEEIVTYRENESDMLLDIRNGKYMNEDGTYQSEFFELVGECEKRLAYAVENSSLPPHPNARRIEELMMSVNERVIRGEIGNLPPRVR